MGETTINATVTTGGLSDAHFMTMPAKGFLAEVCQHRMIGFSAWSRDEMRLAGYLDSEPNAVGRLSG